MTSSTRTTRVVLMAAGFLTLAVGLGLSGPAPTATQWIAIGLLIPLYLIAQRAEFVHGISSSVPTQPVFVGMLLLTPPTTVPLAIATVLLVDNLLQTRTLLEWAATFTAGWFSLGPVLVLVLAAPGPLDGNNWWIYVAALAAQFLVDLTAGATFELLMNRSPQLILKPLRWNQTVDLCLSVIGFSAVVAVDYSLWAVLLLAAPVGLITLLVQDRQALDTDRKSLDQEVTAVRHEARIDPLTGLGNRRAWEETLVRIEHELDSGELHRVGVIMADVDNLKRANDTFGHDAGDELLRTIGRLFAAAAPAEAMVCRIGGDEFAVLLPNPGLTEAAELTARLSAMVAAHPGFDGLRPSAAVGGATYPPAQDLTDAIRLADQAARTVKEIRRARQPSLRRNDLHLLPAPRQSEVQVAQRHSIAE